MFELIFLLVLVFFNSLFIIGLNVVTEEGYILGFIEVLGNKYLPEWLQKPLYGCPPCMASIHSIYYWFFVDFTPINLLIYPGYILALAGLNAIFSSLLNE